MPIYFAFEGGMEEGTGCINWNTKSSELVYSSEGIAKSHIASFVFYFMQICQKRAVSTDF